MTIYKSRQVNLDPEPYVDPATGERFDRLFVKLNGTPITTHDPRPEFEPTRDPEPWCVPSGWQGEREARFSSYADAAEYGRVEWTPRREQFDTPINRVLVDARAIGWRDPNTLDQYPDTAWSADEIEHARKVLTRLAKWTNDLD